jgi:hypothetical protein
MCKKSNYTTYIFYSIEDLVKTSSRSIKITRGFLLFVIKFNFFKVKFHLAHSKNPFHNSKITRDFYNTLLILICHESKKITNELCNFTIDMRFYFEN